MGKLFKNKKTRGRNLLLILIPLIVLVIVFGVLAFNSVKGLIGTASGTATASYSNSIDEYDYHLRSNATDLQKELFAELKDELNKTEKDDEKISILIAKNFVADFYTWTNKSGTTDVGGMFYVYSPNRRSILWQARKYMYQYLNTYIEQYGQENLLEVNGFGEEPTVTKGSVEINGKTYTTYEFTLKWTYKPSNSAFDTSYYATSSWFRVFKNDDGRYEILEIGE